LQRQRDAEGGSLPRNADHLQLAANLAHVLAALEHADAHAGRLGRFEGLEQTVADEFLGHAMAGVTELDDGGVTGPQQLDRDLAVARRRLHRVLNQMSDHALQPLPVGQHRQAGAAQLQRGLGLQRGAAIDRPRQQLVQRQRRRHVRRLVAAQLQKQLLHLVERMRQRLQHIRLKRRIGLMALRVDQQQRQLRHQVLQVVDDEGRHAVERLELARHRQIVGRFAMGQIAGGLAAGDFQHVAHLPVQLQRGAWTRQADEAEQSALQHQRHHQPQARGLGQPGRQGQIAIAPGMAAPLRHLDHPAPLLQKPANSAVAARLVLRQRHVPAGGRLKAVAVAAQPQHPCRAFDQPRQRLDGPLRQRPALLGQAMRAALPLVPIVVASLIEVLVDENFEPCPHGPGEQHHRQQQRRAGQADQLHDRAPGAADVAQIPGAARHRQQIQRGAQQGGRAEHDLPRQQQARGPHRIARRRHRQQRHAERIDHAARGPDIRVYPAKQQGIAVQIKVVGEQGADA
jgi:hypothetical protein